MSNEVLLQLYQDHWLRFDDARSRCVGEMNGPYLVAPHDEYWTAPTKLVFVGQETFGWANHADVASQMNSYSSFGLGRKYYASPYWKVIRKLELQLTGRTFASACLNLNRFDERKRRPNRSNRIVLEELDDLLLKELLILAPDIVIFFTGPGYDGRILRVLQGRQTEIGDYRTRQLCRIECSPLRSKVYRTYHPHYLRRSGLEKTVIPAIRKHALSVD